ncbi:hypothetical protein GLOIN_2v1785379 [Rhizophagus clarus]|uniref:Uncharacterized protein n=1 Tax=Rhizophagus clarus TaxID=94130 RepID=A0A8H3QHX6_9GLOM|nr:hypothetical protein GLOIN_2v1785379 [Rhizophagus clarus]
MDSEDDELEYSNHDISPNIEMERVKRYPDEDSPSGRESLHKSQYHIYASNSLDEYKEFLCNFRFDRKNNKEMIFVTDFLLLWFTKNVFNTSLAFHSINKNEALLEARSILRLARISDIRRNLKPDDDKQRGMNVDGSFQSPIKKLNNGNYKVLRRLHTWFSYTWAYRA